MIPSYVAAFCLLGAFGPRGLLQQLARRRAASGDLRLLGRACGADALDLPLRAPARLRGAARARPRASRRPAAALGQTPATVFRRVTLPALRPSIGAGALLVALYTLSDFGVVSLMRYDALTRAIYLQYRSLFDRTPAAVLALVLVALTALVLLLEARWRRRTARSGPGTARPPRPQPLGRWRWPALAYCAACRGRVPRRAGHGARLLARPRARPGGAALARAAQLDVGFRAGSGRRRGRGRADRIARDALSVALDAATRAALVRGQRPAGHRDRALARLLRGQLRQPALPDAGAARLRLCRSLPAAGARRRRVVARLRRAAGRGGGAVARPRARWRPR